MYQSIYILYYNCIYLQAFHIFISKLFSNQAEQFGKVDSPTFIGLRQNDFNAIISCDVCISEGEAGITLYMDENHHLAISRIFNLLRTFH